MLEARECSKVAELLVFPTKFQILLVIFWIVGLSIFLLLQFGLVYITISGLIAIFHNTRTRLKHPGLLGNLTLIGQNVNTVDCLSRAVKVYKRQGGTK